MCNLGTNGIFLNFFVFRYKNGTTKLEITEFPLFYNSHFTDLTFSVVEYM